MIFYNCKMYSIDIKGEEMKICVKKEKWILVLAVILGAINAVAIAFVSILLQRILDVALRQDMSGFGQLLPVILGYMAALCALSFAEALCGKVLLRNVTRSLRGRIFNGVMAKRPESYYKSNSADYLSAVVNDVKLVEENYLTPLLLSCQMIVLFLATLVILCWLSPMVTGILLGFLLLMFLVPLLFGNVLRQRQERYSATLAAFTEKTKDFFSGYEVIRGFSVGSHIRRKFQQENKAAANAKFRADCFIAVNESLADMLSTLSTVVVVFVAAYMVLRGKITAGTLLALIQLSSTFSVPVLVLMQNVPKMTSMKPIIEKLGHLCDDKTDHEDECARRDTTFKKGLALKDVRFAYEPGKEILKGIDLELKPGGKYALLGESGCGKTTLTKLMTGYSQSYQGSISYDDQEVKMLDRQELSQVVSLIHQNVYLFDSDIYDNICLGEEFSETELEWALQKSGVKKFLAQLEDGIHAKTGENGNRLSGGQRQRIAVARALIRRTPMLILDEGTSAVDKKTARDIESSLLEEDGLTLITITHHMQEDLWERYDRIIRIEEGRVS